MKILILIFLSILILILITKSSQSLNLTHQAKKEKTYLKVQVAQSPNGTTLSQNLIEFINEGKEKMKLHLIRQKTKAVMVLGLTGVGKSTLINYLNDVPLKSIRINGVWRIDYASNSSSISCQLKIGHKNSETLYPSVCTSSNRDFYFIDNPGFQDNRGFEIEIAASFFRHEIIKKVDYLKFLILLNHDDVIDRRVQFFETIKRLSALLGAFEMTELVSLKKFSKSIGFIVSKVNNDGESDETVMVEFLS